jgi:hypothetical protein
MDSMKYIGVHEETVSIAELDSAISPRTWPYTDPVINMAIIRHGRKNFRDNSIRARVLISVRQLMSAVGADGACWRSRAVVPLCG